jgi:hypothetical protein
MGICSETNGAPARSNCGINYIYCLVDLYLLFSTFIRGVYSSIGDGEGEESSKGTLYQKLNRTNRSTILIDYRQTDGQTEQRAGMVAVFEGFLIMYLPVRRASSSLIPHNIVLEFRKPVIEQPTEIVSRVIETGILR